MLAFHDYSAHDLLPKMASRLTNFSPHVSQTEGREIAPIFTRANVTAARIVLRGVESVTRRRLCFSQEVR